MCCEMLALSTGNLLSQAGWLAGRAVAAWEGARGDVEGAMCTSTVCAAVYVDRGI